MSARTLTQAELIAEAAGRFGGDPLDIAFKCPNCGDVATIRDFKAVGDPARAGQECIGRSLGAVGSDPSEYSGRGCDWAAYGLFSGPWFVVMPDGHKVASFSLADAPEVAR